MQYIGIRIEDEGHKELSNSSINFADILNTVWENTDKKKYPYLWSIDPYGLTVFNLNQVDNLKDELRILSKELSEEGKKITNELLTFIEKVEQHTYLVFIGD